MNTHYKELPGRTQFFNDVTQLLYGNNSSPTRNCNPRVTTLAAAVHLYIRVSQIVITNRISQITNHKSHHTRITNRVIRVITTDTNTQLPVQHGLSLSAHMCTSNHMHPHTKWMHPYSNLNALVNHSGPGLFKGCGSYVIRRRGGCGQLQRLRAGGGESGC